MIILQLRPSYYPKGLFDENSLNSSKLMHVGLQSERCPKGTVVIKRVRKEELIMGMRSTLKHSKMMMMHSSSSSSPNLVHINSFEQQVIFFLNFYISYYLFPFCSVCFLSYLSH